jgi:tRNA A-37 threonylcarbamoyl transferase component Bud32
MFQIHCNTTDSAVKTHLRHLLFIGVGVLSLCPSLTRGAALPNEKAAMGAESDELGFLQNSIGTLQADQETKKALTRQQESHPTPAVQKQLGDIAARDAQIGQQTDAIAAKFPDSAKVQQAAAAVIVQGGDYKKGIATAERAAALARAAGDKDSLVAALRVKAAGEMWSGEYPTAAADALAALKIKPDDAHARAIYMMSKDRTAAKPDAPASGGRPLGDVLVESSPLDDPRVKLAGQRATDHLAAVSRLQEAMRFLSVNDPRSALKAARAAQDLDPGLADSYMQQALAWAALKEMARALVEVTKAIGVWTQQGKTQNLPAAYSLRASFQNGLGNPDAAAADADKALSLDPALASAYYQRGRAFAALDRKGAEVLAAYKRAAELDPADYQASYEAAADRLSGAARPSAGPLAAAASAAGRGMRAIVGGAAVLLTLLLGLAGWLSRREKTGGRRAAWKAMGDAEIGGGREPERRSLNSQYDVVEKIGEGGMGTVYRGWDKVLKRPVAVKRLRAELQKTPRERERFIREAEMVASLRHPHIVEIYTIVRDDEDTHLVFEYIVGRTLHDLLNESRGRHLEPARALELLRQIAEAVDHAHSRRVIHRDLKPANVMLADAGWVKVMDFGIARQVQDSMLTTTNTIVGTPTYMAPEQAMGAVVKESDVYALGV